MERPKNRMLSALIVVLQVVGGIYLLIVLAVTLMQRQLLYFPSHDTDATGLEAWRVDGKLIGFSHVVANPQTVWLMLHGNGGQAGHRGYALRCLSPKDGFFVLEYPGYGLRPGKYTQATINQAAREAYLALRAAYPRTPVCILGESLGTGPASYLGTLPQPPDKIVLMTPYDNLPEVAAEHMPWLPARWLLFDRWDNIAALKSYSGPVEIYGAINDGVIPVHHARNVAKSLPHSAYHEIPGGHNDWSDTAMVHFAFGAKNR